MKPRLAILYIFSFETLEKAWKMVDLIAPIVVSAFDADNRNSRKENSENQAGLDGDTVD